MIFANAKSLLSIILWVNKLKLYHGNFNLKIIFAGCIEANLRLGYAKRLKLAKNQVGSILSLAIMYGGTKGGYHRNIFSLVYFMIRS